MNSIHQFSEYEFERILTPEIIRVVQVVQSALMGGATMFALVVVFLHTQHGSDTSTDLDVVTTLSFVHVLFASAAFGMSRILFKRMFTENNLNTSIATSSNPYQGSLTIIRTALLIRMAIMEGAAFFGLVVCMIAVTGGITQNEPLYLLNLASYVLFMIFGIQIFPTKNTLTEMFRNYILKNN